MFPLILLFVPVAIGAAIIMSGDGNPSASKSIGGFAAAILVFVAMILGIAAVLPPGDYRHHKTASSQSSPL
jgi:hypothetical protein